MNKQEEALLLEIEKLTHPSDEDRLDEILDLSYQIKSERIRHQVAESYRLIAAQMHLDAQAQKCSWNWPLELWNKVKATNPNDTKVELLIIECKNQLKDE